MLKVGAAWSGDQRGEDRSGVICEQQRPKVATADKFLADKGDPAISPRRGLRISALAACRRSDDASITAISTRPAGQGSIDHRDIDESIGPRICRAGNRRLKRYC